MEWQDEEGTEDDPWLLISDGRLKGVRGGIGIVLARWNRILEARRYGFKCPPGRFDGAVWLGKSVLLQTTSHLKGKTVLVAEFGGRSVQREQDTKVGYLVEMSTCQVGWVGAQHDVWPNGSTLASDASYLGVNPSTHRVFYRRLRVCFFGLDSLHAIAVTDCSRYTRIARDISCVSAQGRAQTSSCAQ